MCLPDQGIARSQCHSTTCHSLHIAAIGYKYSRPRFEIIDSDDATATVGILAYAEVFTRILPHGMDGWNGFQDWRTDRHQSSPPGILGCQAGLDHQYR